MKDKLVFVHDHKFRKIENHLYSIGGLNDSALIRYTSVFKNVIVLARIIDEKIGEKSKYSLITDKKVTIKGKKSLFTYKEMKNELLNTEKVIVRMPSFNGILALHLCRVLKKDYLIEVVGCPWDSLWNYSLFGKLIAPIVTLINKYEIKRACYCIYVTDYFLQRRYPTKGKSIGCSNVFIKDFDDKIIENRIKRIKKNNNTYILGTTAAIDVAFKGQDTVIKAISYLKKLGITNIQYQLVGNGNQARLQKIALKYNVLDQIVFVGGLKHESVFNWLDKIDLYIQPSKQEGLPRALIEAMSRGLPCIGANTAGIPELLDKDFIFNYKGNEVKELSEIIIKMFEKETMINQVERNYNKSKNYNCEILENRRKKFLIDFKNQ